jgi:gamma-glutamylputrescine oxidase
MPDAPLPTFHDETAIARPERAALVYDLDVEAVVVGGGYAGLWTALSLAARGKTVALIEAGRLGEGASGRNAGFVAPGYATSIETLLGRVGPDHARALWALSVAGVERVRGLIAEPGMAGVAPVAGKLTLWRHGDGSGAQRRAERLDAWGTAAQVWTGERLAEAVTSARYVAGMHQPEAFHVHPLNLLIGLAAAAEAAGARLFEMTPATAVDLGGLRKVVTTPRGRLRAQDVVFCGSAALRQHLSGLGRFVLPVRTHMAATAPLGEALAGAIRYTGAIADTRRGGD